MNKATLLAAEKSLVYKNYYLKNPDTYNLSINPTSTLYFHFSCMPTGRKNKIISSKKTLHRAWEQIAIKQGAQLNVLSFLACACLIL